MIDIELYESWCEYNAHNNSISFAEYCYQQGKADATRWIPVSERLPEIGVCVLVAELIDDKCYCGLGNMKDNGVWYISIQTPDFPDGNMQGNEVIAWMQLPEAPKGDVEE